MHAVIREVNMLYILSMHFALPLSSCSRCTLRGKGEGDQRPTPVGGCAEEWPRRRFRAARPWGAPSCWLSAAAGTQHCSSARRGFLRPGCGQEGCPLLQMRVGGHEVTRSTQISKCMRKHLENSKATDRRSTGITFLWLNLGKRP